MAKADENETKIQAAELSHRPRCSSLARADYQISAQLSCVLGAEQFRYILRAGDREVDLEEAHALILGQIDESGLTGLAEDWYLEEAICLDIKDVRRAGVGNAGLDPASENSETRPKEVVLAEDSSRPAFRVKVEYVAGLSQAELSELTGSIVSASSSAPSLDLGKSEIDRFDSKQSADFLAEIEGTYGDVSVCIEKLQIRFDFDSNCYVAGSPAEIVEMRRAFFKRFSAEIKTYKEQGFSEIRFSGSNGPLELTTLSQYMLQINELLGNGPVVESISTDKDGSTTVRFASSS